jgi:hypothetical protein
MIKIGEVPETGIAEKIGEKKMDSKKKTPQITVESPVFAPSWQAAAPSGDIV